MQSILSFEICTTVGFFLHSWNKILSVTEKNNCAAIICEKHRTTIQYNELLEQAKQNSKK